MIMEERRRFVRLDTRLEVTYTVLPSGSPQRVVTRDVGGGGICFFADRVLQPGTRLQISMKLPDREEGVHFTAEVVVQVNQAAVAKVFYQLPGSGINTMQVGTGYKENPLVSFTIRPVRNAAVIVQDKMIKLPVAEN